MLTEAARITYDSKRGRLGTAGAALSLTAPAIEPMFASIGTVENLAVFARIAPGAFAPLPPITIEEASVTLLGGRLRARGVDYDVKRETNRLAIELENFDLGRIVAIERQFGIEASGTLDGRLPLSLSPRGVTIAGGELHARPVVSCATRRTRPPGRWPRRTQASNSCRTRSATITTRSSRPTSITPTPAT